jgi:hypothetical protein
MQKQGGALVWTESAFSIEVLGELVKPSGAQAGVPVLPEFSTCRLCLELALAYSWARGDWFKAALRASRSCVKRVKRARAI